MSAVNTRRPKAMIVAWAASLLSVWLLCLSASAATVSGTVRYWDSRSYRSANTGSYLSQAVGNRPMDGAYVYLFDMDGSCADLRTDCGESDDDFINAVFTNSQGFYSISQNLQGVPIPLSELVYLVFVFYDTAGNSVNYNVVSTTFEYGVASNTVGVTSSNTTLNFNTTCYDETRNAVQGLCDSQADVNAFFLPEEAVANLFASMIDFRRRGTQGSTGGQDAFWPDHPDGWCGGDLAGAALYGEFCVDDGADNHVTAHEMGHNVQGTIMNLGTLSNCTSGLTWTGSDPQKCVAAEGFAHFASGATWWNQNAVSPDYRGYFLEGNTTAGNPQALPCVSNNTNPEYRRGNMARFFWDIYDSTSVGTNDGGGDDETLSFWNMATVYGEFPPGTSDRQASESSSNGRNVWDYAYWGGESFSWWFGVEAEHNCIDAQSGPYL